MAAEARDIVRRAAGDVAGLTVAAQIRQAARHLGYAPEDWRIREAWYGRAGSWSATALDELRRRGAAWRDDGRGTPGSKSHVAAVLRQLDRLKSEVATLEVEVGRFLSIGADDQRVPEWTRKRLSCFPCSSQSGFPGSGDGADQDLSH